MSPAATPTSPPQAAQGRQSSTCSSSGQRQPPTSPGCRRPPSQVSSPRSAPRSLTAHPPLPPGEADAARLRFDAFVARHGPRVPGLAVDAAASLNLVLNGTVPIDEAMARLCDDCNLSASDRSARRGSEADPAAWVGDPCTGVLAHVIAAFYSHYCPEHAAKVPGIVRFIASQPPEADELGNTLRRMCNKYAARGAMLPDWEGPYPRALRQPPPPWLRAVPPQSEWLPRARDAAAALDSPRRAAAEAAVASAARELAGLRERLRLWHARCAALAAAEAQVRVLREAQEEEGAQQRPRTPLLVAGAASRLMRRLRSPLSSPSDSPDTQGVAPVSLEAAVAVCGSAEAAPGCDAADGCDEDAQRMVQQSRKRFIRWMELSVRRFLRAHEGEASFEDWIAVMHPENVQMATGEERSVDPRLYLPGSAHRTIWNAAVGGRSPRYVCPTGGEDLDADGFDDGAAHFAIDAFWRTHCPASSAVGAEAHAELKAVPGPRRRATYQHLLRRMCSEYHADPDDWCTSDPRYARGALRFLFESFYERYDADSVAKVPGVLAFILEGRETREHVLSRLCAKWQPRGACIEEWLGSYPDALRPPPEECLGAFDSQHRELLAEVAVLRDLHEQWRAARHAGLGPQEEHLGLEQRLLQGLRRAEWAAEDLAETVDAERAVGASDELRADAERAAVRALRAEIAELRRDAGAEAGAAGDPQGPLFEVIAASAAAQPPT
eukprot:TRINITY_DN11670_c0_g1_i1.p1 TRINITY_DN11670_c0_g1~~TRINITY_DN11670_c0_g1_i1.p1  ORF type:complete len:723 (+),score=240.63 TRINITY_DN11670_c0_g1_i1:100-2268(+)